MGRLKEERARALDTPTTSYAPIARALMQLDEREKVRMKHKFEICYVLAREGIAFLMYPIFHALAERQGVELGSLYKTPDSARLFTHFIAESQRERFRLSLSTSNTPFFSFLLDGSTDAGNIEQELVFMLFCYKDDNAKEIRSCTRYIATVNPTRANAEGLIASLSTALTCLGITLDDKRSVLKAEGRPALIGGGSDGASVNIGVHKGLKAPLQSMYPWLFWSWCFSHRLELACKDACTSSLFTNINEMLLRLFYLYHKSSKKSRELASIAEDLKEVFQLPKGGNVPVRCQGTRWIGHKRKALQQIVDSFGAYITHLGALAADSGTKPDDRARITGYLRKWSQGKMLVGCAMYIDVLKAPALLSLCLQKDGVDIIYCIEQILKSADALDSLAKQDPKQWPSVKLVLSRISEEGEEKSYKGGTITHYSDSTVTTCSTQALADLKHLSSSLKERLAWSDMQLLRSILVFLDTCSWASRAKRRRADGSDSEQEEDEEDDKAEIRAAAEYISSIFREPLEAKNACLASLNDEVDEVVDFCRKYLDVLEDYTKVWYKLHITPDARNWPNVLLLSQLLFSLPFTNSIVERAFSTMKVVKTNRRTSLLTSTLDNLMEINVEGPTPENFNADGAVQLWWLDCTRRPNQSARKEYRPRVTKNPPSESSSSDSEQEEFALDEWDRLFTD